MFKDANVMFLYTETPLHAGSGSSVSYIDLPIQRERHTQYPMVQASGIKGAARDTSEERLDFPGKKARLKEIETKKKNGGLSDDEKRESQAIHNELLRIATVFGPDTDSDRAHEHAGAVSFTDARLLLFPVRSLKGVFAWITCPTAIERFKRDLQKIKMGGQWALPDATKLEVAFNPGEGAALINSGSKLKVNDDRVVLEDFAFSATETENVGKLAEWLGTHALPSGSGTDESPYKFWSDRLKSNLVVVDDDSFRDFVQFSTQVDTHIRIGETGTVEAGALWTEESLPPETLLYTLVLTTDPRRNHNGITDAAKVLESVAAWIKAAPILQFGGNETTGQGIIKATFLDRQFPSAGQQGGNHAADTTSEA